MAGNETIVITGLKETLAGLKQFDVDAVKKFNKVINAELRQGKRDAQQLIIEAVSRTDTGAPLSHWKTTDRKEGPKTQAQAKKIKDNKIRLFPTWNTAEAVAGIVASKAEGKVRGDYTTSAGALINKSRHGAIFEIAGRKPGAGKNASGTAFKNKLNEFYGEASRVVWRIVDRDGSKIQATFMKALEEAKETLQKNLESQRID